MIIIKELVDMTKNLDVSLEEACFMNILYHRDFTSLFKYVFFTPETKEGVDTTNSNPNYVRYTEEKEIGSKKRIGATTYVVGDRAKRAIGSDMIDNLLRKGYIKSYANVDKPTFNPTYYEVTEIIEKYFLFHTDKCIEELVEVYPKSIFIDGKQIPLILMDYDILAEVYAKNITFSMKKHKEILEIITSNKDTINYKLENFIRSKMWKDLSISRQVEKIEAI